LRTKNVSLFTIWLDFDEKGKMVCSRQTFIKQICDKKHVVGFCIR
jgi:hypothetical protein